MKPYINLSQRPKSHFGDRLTTRQTCATVSHDFNFLWRFVIVQLRNLARYSNAQAIHPGTYPPMDITSTTTTSQRNYISSRQLPLISSQITADCLSTSRSWSFQSTLWLHPQRSSIAVPATSCLINPVPFRRKISVGKCVVLRTVKLCLCYRLQNECAIFSAPWLTYANPHSNNNLTKLSAMVHSMLLKTLRLRKNMLNALSRWKWIF